jgi:ferredoxin
MKVVVDYDMCDSHGNCVEIVPEVFELRDDGSLHLLQETLVDGLTKKVQDAVVACPTGAITIEN